MHRRELAVLAVVGALVLWGGAAAAVQAPADQTATDAADVSPAVLQQDGDVGENETTEDNETADGDTGVNDTTEADDEGAGDADETTAGNDTAEANESEEGMLSVDSLTAPAYAPTNTTLEVTATVENTGGEERTEDIAFRLEGGGVDVVVHQNVTVDAGETENVTFEVETAVPEDEYIHGVTTYDSSEFDEITISDDAAVGIDDQDSDGTTVTVDSLYVPEGGYVTIHDSTLLEGDALGSVVGVSEYMDAGYHEDVNVTLFEGVEGADFEESELTENETLIAMPHLETTDDETYDFVASEGEDDGPYTTDGEAVTDAGDVMLVTDDDTAPVDEEEETTSEDETTTADGNETAADGTTTEADA